MNAPPRSVRALFVALLLTFAAPSGAAHGAGESPVRVRAQAAYQKALLDYRADTRETRLDALRKALAAAAASDPGYVEPPLRLAMIAESVHDFDQALQWLSRAAAAAPTPESAAAVRQQIQRVEERKHEWFAPGGETRVRYEEALVLAGVYLDARLFEPARVEAAAALQIAPDRYEAYTLAAAADRGLGRLEEAAANLKIALARSPVDKRTVLEKALQEVEKDRNFTHVLQSAEEDLKQGRYAAAVTAFATARQLRPDDERLALRAALALVLANQADEAAMVLRPLAASREPAVRREATEQIALLDRVRAVSTRVDRIGEEAALGFQAEGVPAALRDKLRELLLRGHVVQGISIAPDGSWLIVCGDTGYSGVGLPPALVTALKKYRADGKPIRRALLAPGGGWLVVAGERADDFSWAGLPASANEYLGKLAQRHDALIDAAFFDDGGWALILGTDAGGGNGYAADRAPADLQTTMARLSGNGERMTHLAASGGSWIVLRDPNGWVGDKVPETLLLALRSAKSIEGAVRTVSLAPKGGWLVVVKQAH